MTVSDSDEGPKWQPLNVRDTPAAADYEALVEGIPDYLERSLWRWAMDRAVRTPDMNLKAERLLKVQLPDPRTNSHVFDAYWQSVSTADRLALVDFFLRDLQDVFDALKKDQRNRSLIFECIEHAKRLDDLLVEGGSIWRTSTNPYWGLVRRVNESTQALVDLVSTAETDAARKIASAWNACYRHEPDYDRAYRDAVFAVEAVALPVVIPNNKRGTLGNVVAHIADTVDHWTVGGMDAERQASGATLLATLRTLWHSQQRHAQNDGTIRDVGREEAETAVTLSVTLVHWFASGLVKDLRRPNGATD